MGGKPYGVSDEVTNKKLKHKKNFPRKPVRPKVMKIEIRCSLLVRSAAKQISISQLIPRKSAKLNSISQVTSQKTGQQTMTTKRSKTHAGIFLLRLDPCC